MFDYPLKTKIILVLSLLVVISGLYFVSSYNTSRARDLYMVSQVRTLATAMENYFDLYNHYPEIAKVNLSSVRALSENGLNKPGEKIFFSNSKDFLRDGSITSSEGRYIIEFRLERSWDTWQIDSYGGGTCRMSNNLVMICQPN